MCMCVSVCVRMSICMYVHMYVCMCVYAPPPPVLYPRYSTSVVRYSRKHLFEVLKSLNWFWDSKDTPLALEDGVSEEAILKLSEALCAHEKLSKEITTIRRTMLDNGLDGLSCLLASFPPCMDSPLTCVHRGHLCASYIHLHIFI